MYTAERGEHTVIASQPGGVASRLLDHVSATDDDTLTTRARELAGEISAAEANLAAVLAEIERRHIHSAWECATIERFAAWHCQLKPSRTKGLAVLGRALGELPVVAEAVTDGTLSFDKATTIARVAAPDTEGALVQMALHATVAQTQRICGAWRRVEHQDDPHGIDGDDDRRPTVVVIRDDDGIEICARFDHVHGELVLAGIDHATKTVRTERQTAVPADPAAGTDPTGIPACPEDRPTEQLTRAEWRAQGLLRIVEHADTDPPGTVHASGFDTTVVVHVGIDTLHGPDWTRYQPHPPGGRPIRRSPARRDEMAELEPAGIRIRRDIARWLACDAGILTVIEDHDGNPLHLGPRTNPIPPTLRRAVLARHRTCTWPGCCATAVQLHHIHHRAHGGHDDIEALAPQCPTHHRTIHTRHITVTVDPDGTFHHWRPDHTEIHAVPPGPTTRHQRGRRPPRPHPTTTPLRRRPHRNQPHAPLDRRPPRPQHRHRRPPHPPQRRPPPHPTHHTTHHPPRQTPTPPQLTGRRGTADPAGYSGMPKYLSSL